jgi:nitrite reductase (NADH) small subunit
MSTSSTVENKTWQTICHKDELIKHSGVCALLENEEQIAIFKIDDEQAYAVSNWDPSGQANVLYRGMIGDEAGEIFVASPLYKERFSLLNGRCLDNESLFINHYETRIENEQVQILN